ncbi:hypothetical protein B566_EDAN013760 [Ephemera danica]|nr:hypothetical protein B566_EDAN013760 [Ephemera danica]
MNFINLSCNNIAITKAIKNKINFKKIIMYSQMEMAWLREQYIHQAAEDPEKMLIAAPEHHHHQFLTPITTMPTGFEEMEAHNPMEVTNYMMMDGDYDTYDEPPKYMSSAATQTIPQQPNKKIKPVKHPGLKLKTPIAYQRDSDLSIIPIQREGMAVCEKCGAIGVKHAFYTRERRFCSLECSRGGQDSAPSIPQLDTANEELQEEVEEEEGEEEEEEEVQIKMELEPQQEIKAHKPLPPAIPPLPPDDPPLPLKRKCAELANTYEWSSQLTESSFIAAPVTCFRHAPLADSWDNVIVGMKVEVENTDCEHFSEDFPDSFWVATVLRIAGYKALLRYEGFGQDTAKDFWVNLCSAVVHPVGWCATRGKPLIPPKSIQDKYKDWKQFLVKRLTGARTLPSNFYNKISDSLKSRFRCGLHLEVVDKNRISQVKVATITKIVGKRLHVQYYDAEKDSMGFWCHEDSPLIHPVGWAQHVGHHIEAESSYLERCREGSWLEEDAGSDLFPVPRHAANHLEFQQPPGDQFLQGMKLEAIDPLNLSAICVATVMRVLREGYIMIRIDSYDADANGADWFCYHASSPCVFPPGFCEMNSIPLTPPKGYEDDFDWDSYLRRTGAVAAPLSLFNCADMASEVPPHSFRVGMRVEAADLMDPRLVCVATVSRVVGRLLKVHFDGWEEEYDQWLDCDSPDFYPVGWCELVSHKLEGPRGTVVSNGATPGGHRLSPALHRSLSLSRKRKPKRRHKKVRAQPVRRRSSHQVGMPTRSSDRLLREPAQATRVAAMKPDSPRVESPIESEGVPDYEPEMGDDPASPMESPVPPTSASGGSGMAGGVCEAGELVPDEWNVFDVAQFLRVNDCASYCDSFSKKDQIMDLTGFKVGPSLKIHDLIQQLKIKVNPSQERLKLAAFRKLL